MIRCPDWQRLLRHRIEEDLEAPEDWQEALEHLESCDDCRAEAYGKDPSLVFLDFPEVTVSTDEIQKMKAAVATLRHGLVIAANDSSEGQSPGADAGSSPFLRGGFRRAAAAAVLLAAGLGFTFGTDLGPTEVVDETAASPMEISPLVGGDTYGGGTMPASLRDAPILEDVGGPHARVYSYPIAPEEKIALVMVIDPDLDV